LSAVRAFESHFDGRMKLISRETSIDLSGD
jgi:hypothetical protein